MLILTQMARFALVMRWIKNLIEGEMIESTNLKRTYMFPILEGEKGVSQKDLNLVCEQVNAYFGTPIIGNGMGEILPYTKGIEKLKELE